MGSSCVVAAALLAAAWPFLSPWCSANSGLVREEELHVQALVMELGLRSGQWPLWVAQVVWGGGPGLGSLEAGVGLLGAGLSTCPVAGPQELEAHHCPFPLVD